MITNYANRDLGQRWPAVRIIKGIPGHPEGALRYPRPEQREQWERQGICAPVEDNVQELRLDNGEPLRQRKKRKKGRKRGFN